MSFSISIIISFITFPLFTLLLFYSFIYLRFYFFTFLLFYLFPIPSPTTSPSSLSSQPD